MPETSTSTCILMQEAPGKLFSMVVALTSQCVGWLPVRSCELHPWQDACAVVWAASCLAQGWWEQKPLPEGKAVR